MYDINSVPCLVSANEICRNKRKTKKKSKEGHSAQNIKNGVLSKRNVLVKYNYCTPLLVSKKPVYTLTQRLTKLNRRTSVKVIMHAPSISDITKLVSNIQCIHYIWKFYKRG